jgi:hypothetical protein
LDLLVRWLQVLLITLKYSAIAVLHTSQFTVAYALGFFVFTSRLLAMDLNTETSTSNHCEVFLPFLVQSHWNIGTQLKTPQLQADSRYIAAARTTQKTADHTESTSHVIAKHCCGVTSLRMRNLHGHKENTAAVLYDITAYAESVYRAVS